MDTSSKISWFRQTNTQWTTLPHRGGNYIGTIALGAGASPYQLTVNPGAVVSNHKTLRNAKNRFRKFLFDKPVK